jgi:hypothetical protein
MGLARRRLAAVVLLALALAGAFATVAAAKDPRREQERLTPADMALASRVSVRASDLARGWTQTAVPPENGSMSCPGFDPDFSRFTITGKSRTAFSSTGGRSVVSLVEVYASRAQAVGDFRLGAQPALARCLRTTLEDAVPAGTNLTLRVRSSRMQPLGGVGENGAAFRLVASLSSGNVSLPLYLDALVFQRGRTITALMFTSAMERVPGQLALARAVARRMR